MRMRERWTPQRLEAFQTQKLRTLRDWAYARSGFYRDFHAGLSDAPLRDLPVLTKAMLMNRFDGVVTDLAIHLGDVRAYVAHPHQEERFLGRYWVNSTSGTSGHPGLFVVNRDEWSIELATALRAFEWAGLTLKPTRRAKIAQITSTNPSHLSMQGGRDMANWWMPTLLMDASAPLAAMVDRLNAWAPGNALGLCVDYSPAGRGADVRASQNRAAHGSQCVRAADGGHPPPSSRAQLLAGSDAPCGPWWPCGPCSPGPMPPRPKKPWCWAARSRTCCC